MTVARFTVPIPNYAIGAPEGCQVIIDLDALLFSVRIKRRRKLYTLPLVTVAGWVVHRLVLAEVAAKRAAKRARRRRGG